MLQEGRGWTPPLPDGPHCAAVWQLLYPPSHRSSSSPAIIQNASLKPHVYAQRSARSVRNLARADAYFVLYCLAGGLRKKKANSPTSLMMDADVSLSAPDKFEAERRSVGGKEWLAARGEAL